ncbi:MAG: 4-hydroxy-3-methylbut-2-enyl diphosphate reductase [Spirochaetota bacterium]|nr:4-hydroxy-3-methylbut-2-enyl diphosphate reductase [Spirochaetota bacterium]
MMKISLASNSGFCMGVKNAVLRIVNEINSGNEDISVYGPLIHNPQTIEVLKSRGLITIDNLDAIDNRTVAIRTHGVTFDIQNEIREKASRCINLTCPRVARVQGIIKRYAQEEYFTLITGDRNHAEVIGLMSYATSGAFIITDIGDIDKIALKEKLILVSQTTFDSMLFNRIELLLKEKFPDIIVFNTICDSTYKRQGDVIYAIEHGIDALVVVGGKNSANTKRLAQIGIDQGIKTLHIETEKDLKHHDFNDVIHVLVTAGASTPGWIINNVLDCLYDFKYQKSNIIISLLKRSIEFFVRTNILFAITSFFITCFVQLYLLKAIDYRLSFLSFFYFLSVNTISNYSQINYLKTSNPYKFSLYNKWKKSFLFLSFSSLFISFLLTLNYDWPIIVTYVSTLFGLIPLTGIMGNIIHKTKDGFYQSLYNAQIFITSGIWMVISAILPAMHLGIDLSLTLPLLLFLYTFFLMRNILLSIISHQGDIIQGKESFPIRQGARITRLISIGISAISLIIYVISSLIHSYYIMTFFSFTIIYYCVLLIFFLRLNYLISLKYEFLVELNLLLFIVLYLIAITVYY